MKKIFNYIFYIAVAFSFSSCEKYLDVNTSPNSPTAPPLNGLLGRTTEETAINVYRVGDNVTGNYVQYLASSTAASPSDVFDPVDFSSTWSSLYKVMTDIHDMDILAGEKNSPHHQGVARILMAINLKMVHDLWGDAPYSQAFQDEYITPEYDKAEDIYNTCMNLLGEGVALLQGANTGIALDGSLDFIHDGDTDAWIKTAHALKARWLNQLSKKATYSADNILTELAAAYGPADDEAEITVFDVRNPWSDVAVDNAALVLGGWLSDNIVNAMNGQTYGVADPRLPIITNLTKFGDYRGTRNGAGRVGSGTDNEECYLTVNGWYSSTNSPLSIISYAECKFIEAEALFRKNGATAEAYAAYIAGIKANMNKMNLPASEIDSYANAPSVSVGAAGLTLDLIMKEKYKALFLNPETWNDARRYDYRYKDFRLPLNATTSSFIRRLVYPEVEKSRNGANTPEISDVTQKLWWDE